MGLGKTAKGFYTLYALVVVGAVALLYYLRPVFTPGTAIGLVFFMGLTLLTEAMAIRLPRGGGTVSVGFVVIYASLLIFGPGAGGLVAALGTFQLDQLTRQRIVTVIFNRAQLGLAAALAGLVYVGLGGLPGAVRLPHDIAALFMSGLTYAAVNILITVFGFSLLRGLSPWNTWVVNFRWFTPTYLVFIPVGILIAIIYPVTSYIGVLLFLFPLLIARYTFRRYMDMREAYRSTIRALAAALDAKDPHTLGHAERVAKYAVAIGRRLNLSEDQVELLEYVGVLHDIGKIGIGDAILNKPGIFTCEEYEEMKKHPVIGAEIIASIQLLGKAAAWVRYHHERYDGTGFPEGLKGTEIPFGARIMAVADAFDAMTSDRPYKKALSLQDSRRELVTCSGRQFDPQVVQAILQVLAEPTTGIAISPAGFTTGYTD